MKKKPSSKSTGTVEMRGKAEAKLHERKKKTASHAPAEADIQRLVHELEVHQIELEMQNDELTQSRAEAESLLREYTDLYDFAPVGYFTLGRIGTIHKANLAGANLLGVERSKLIKRRFGVFVSAQSRSTFNIFIENVFRNGQKNICEVSLMNGGNEPLWVRIEAICSDVSRGEHGVCSTVVSDITQFKQAMEMLKIQSTHDILTGLYNRHYFVEEMERLERGRKFPCSVIMADVDYLKDTNDQYGHSAGDDLLKKVAQVLTTSFRAEDVIARIGGDEFAVLMPSTDATMAKTLLRRVYHVIEEHNTANTGKPISLSLGVSTAENPVSLSVLLREADENMYSEKKLTKGAPHQIRANKSNQRLIND
jgi:diguanylate cyclase (GGDEF)-like protein